MYELKNGTKRLVSALQAVSEDEQTIKRLASCLCYRPGQLQQDIEALCDYIRAAEQRESREENQSQGITITEHKAEQKTDGRKARKKVNDEVRQYARELHKIGNSTRTIATAIGMSTTQTHAILQEADIPGKWYSLDNGSRRYYRSYLDAVNSGVRQIHFQPEKEKGQA